MTRTSTAVDYSRRHLCFGWWALVVFLVLGFALELLHGLKVSWYLNVSMQPRRLMWTLAHAHGALIGMINIAFGLMVAGRDFSAAWIRRASPFLLGASILLPGGFFLGGLSVHGGDPNPAVLVVSLGALLLIVGVAFAALSVCRK